MIIDEKSETEIYKSNDLVVSLLKDVEKFQKLVELARRDRIETIKNSIRYFFFDKAIIYSAKEWITKVNKKEISKSKKCDEKIIFKGLQEHLRKLFNDSNIEIINITCFGYNDIAFCIEFKSQKFKFSIDIPNLEANFSVKEFEEYLHMGKLAIGVYESDSCITIFETSYKEEDIAKAYKDYILKHIGDNN